MRKLRSRAAASIAVLAAFSMTATPVLARDGDGGWRYRHHRHHDGVDGSSILAGLLIVGGVVAIASAVSKASQDRQPDEAERYPGGPDDGAQDDGAPDDGGYSQAPEEPDSGPYNGDAPEGDEGGAPDSGYSAGAYAHNGFGVSVDRCLDELQRGENRVETIDNVRHAGDLYDVEGRLADGRDFACSVDEEGQVRSVDINGRAMI